MQNDIDGDVSSRMTEEDMQLEQLNEYDPCQHTEDRLAEQA